MPNALCAMRDACLSFTYCRRFCECVKDERPRSIARRCYLLVHGEHAWLKRLLFVVLHSCDSFKVNASVDVY